MKKHIKKHLKVLLAGVLHALKSTAAVVLLTLSVALLVCVPLDSGYFAVGKFVAALLGIALSVMLFYNCGVDIAKGRFSR